MDAANCWTLGVGILALVGAVVFIYKKSQQP